MIIPITTILYVLIFSLCIALFYMWFIGKNVICTDPNNDMSIEMKRKKIEELRELKRSKPRISTNDAYRRPQNDTCHTDWSLTKYLR